MNTKPIWLLLFLFCLPAIAIAAGNMHIGQLEIHPYVLVKESYNDNIYAVNTDTKSDWITTTTPGIKLLMPFRVHTLSAGYQAEIAKLADFTSEDTIDHHAYVLGDFKLGSYFTAKLGDNFTRGHEARASTYSGEIEKYDRNAATAGISYVMTDRTQVRMDYTRTRWDFDLVSNQFRNRNENLLSTYMYYRFLPKTSAFVEYDFRAIDYDQKTLGLDSRVNIPYLGLTWSLSEYTQGTAKWGYLFKRFDSSSYKDIDTFAASVDIAHGFTDNSRIRLIGVRDVNETNDKNVIYYTTTGALVEYTYRMSYKISALARASYGIDDYVNVSPTSLQRQDHTYIAGAGLRYQMRDWLEFGLDYSHTDRDSNIDYRNLVNNVYAFSINMAY